MLIEQVELTLSHVGLGGLSEFSLLALFASAQAHALMQGRSHTLNDVVDRDGAALYPSYYMTHVTVPPGANLASYRVWDRVEVGVEVSCFGGVLLDSNYALGRKGSLGDGDWETRTVPRMHASSMFVLDNHVGEQQLSRPRAGCLAELPSLASPPASMDRFREARVRGRIGNELRQRPASTQPLTHAVVPVRDAALGRAMMFAKFTEIMEIAERQFLQRLRPAFPGGLLDCRAPLERETYYFANVRAGATIETYVTAHVDTAPRVLAAADADAIAAPRVSFELELFEAQTNELLAVSRSSSVFAIGKGQQSALRDAERLLNAHAELSLG
jgi:probable biosynthetic protein (TIGR04098 family)